MVKLLELKGVRLARINNKYVNRSYALTKEYRDFINMVSLLVNKRIKIRPPVKVVIEVATYFDIDSFIKPLLDSLESAIGNDKNVEELHVYKKPLKKGRLSDLKVYACTIREIEGD